ncbi:MAG: PIN domain nuclease [Chlorobiales bacterium]|nr:PIN domain nuclease [Chlorobiales bacterium]
MILVDTSVWIEVLRDRQGDVVESFRKKTHGEILVLSRFAQLELLQGAKSGDEWKLLEKYLSTQFYLEATEKTWVDAARIFFELRRKGITVRSSIDCCIAQIALEHDALLLHKDADFDRIASIRPLRFEWFTE